MSRIIHFEIPASDPQSSIDFYSKVFGWKISKWGDNDYWLISTGEESEPGINGAILPRRAPDMPVVNSIAVADIHFAIQAVEENGGTIVVPLTTIPGIGYLCYFKDPDGMIHGINQNDRQAGSTE